MADHPLAAFISIPKAARILGVGETTLQSAIRRGELSFYVLRNKMPRLKVSDLERWVETRRRTRAAAKA